MAGLWNRQFPIISNNHLSQGTMVIARSVMLQIHAYHSLSITYNIT